MTQDGFIARLTKANGGRGVLTDPRATERWRKGWRSGGGDAEAVVAPRSLWSCGGCCRSASRAGAS